MKETRFKKTELGLIPEEWEVRKLSDVAYINQQNSDIPEMFHYIDLESVKNGQYKLSPKINRKYAPSRAQRTFENGDILYQTVRPYQKNNLYVTFSNPENYVASTGYAVIRCFESNSKYIYNSIMQDNFVKIVLDNCTGTSYPAIKPSKLGSLPIIIPPSFAEQTAIARALTDMDDLISSLKKLKEKKRNIKQGAMQQLLSGKQRLEGFEEPWVEKMLGEVLDYEQPSNYLVESTNYVENGIPVLTAGKTFILGYTNERHGIYENVPVIIFDDFTTESRYVDFPFKAKSSAMKMLHLKDTNNNLRFISEIMNTIDFYAPEHKRYWISRYSQIKVLLPSLTEQTAIARVLTDMDAELAALSAKLAKYEDLKQGMMQQLLTGKIRLV